MWEALAQASFDRLDNLTAIIDVNRLGQTGPTRYEWDLDLYADRFRAFGWHTIEIDGHDVEAVDRGIRRGRRQRRTSRRRSSPGPSRARACPRSRTSSARTASRSRTRRPRSPSWAAETNIRPAAAAAGQVASSRTRFETRRARRCRATSWARRSPRARRSATRSPRWARHAAMSWRSTARSATRPTRRSSPRQIPERFFQMYIAEQQMIGAAVGMQVRGWRPFAATFAAFLTRALRLRPHGRRQPRQICACAARTPACRSARTARRRWASRTSPRCAPSTAAPCSTRPTPTRRPSCSP